MKDCTSSAEALRVGLVRVKFVSPGSALIIGRWARSGEDAKSAGGLLVKMSFLQHVSVSETSHGKALVVGMAGWHLERLGDILDLSVLRPSLRIPMYKYTCVCRGRPKEM
ncbi:hypothetical protein N7508_011125 [Penicillium antarcticum]|uniref:uncharacterized protein n=1 Tax=Penicillium antarcticum TaxID=416450 RepID=UPI00238307BB|nr:uncharacterized protein N7508_011113 [Penicillium antarcticum]XP_058314163.1 uncharacterized protein N7508_011125 [Penicillium antarcticum]KAJ5288338.1 hypothetical protein N7508_011113 [Penicillium antarcticum]KAJ5288350.1 hypothetical protein N7508_011125 [Penicillium antarcticum]